jgi:YggT family protein
MGAVIWLISTVLDLFVWVLIINAILSWLVAFNVVNIRNRFVGMVDEFCRRVSEPVLAPVRRILPTLGGIDLSPMVVILGVMFLQRLIVELLG